MRGRQCSGGRWSFRLGNGPLVRTRRYEGDATDLSFRQRHRRRTTWLQFRHGLVHGQAYVTNRYLTDQIQRDAGRQRNSLFFVVMGMTHRWNVGERIQVGTMRGRQSSSQRLPGETIHYGSRSGLATGSGRRRGGGRCSGNVQDVRRSHWLFFTVCVCSPGSFELWPSGAPEAFHLAVPESFPLGISLHAPRRNAASWPNHYFRNTSSGISGNVEPSPLIVNKNILPFFYRKLSTPIRRINRREE